MHALYKLGAVGSAETASIIQSAHKLEEESIAISSIIIINLLSLLYIIGIYIIIDIINNCTHIQ